MQSTTGKQSCKWIWYLFTVETVVKASFYDLWKDLHIVAETKSIHRGTWFSVIVVGIWTGDKKELSGERLVEELSQLRAQSHYE